MCRGQTAGASRTVVRRRLGPLLDDLQLRTRTLPLRFDSADAAFEALLRTQPLDRDAHREALRPGFERLLSSCNGAAPAVELDARYLAVVGRRKM